MKTTLALGKDAGLPFAATKVIWESREHLRALPTPTNTTTKPKVTTPKNTDQTLADLIREAHTAAIGSESDTATVAITVTYNGVVRNFLSKWGKLPTGSQQQKGIRRPIHLSTVRFVKYLPDDKEKRNVIFYYTLDGNDNLDEIGEPEVAITSFLRLWESKGLTYTKPDESVTSTPLPDKNDTPFWSHVFDVLEYDNDVTQASPVTIDYKGKSFDFIALKSTIAIGKKRKECFYLSRLFKDKFAPTSKEVSILNQHITVLDKGSTVLIASAEKADEHAIDYWKRSGLIV